MIRVQQEIKVSLREHQSSVFGTNTCKDMCKEFFLVHTQS